MLKSPRAESQRHAGILGGSPATVYLRNEIARVAPFASGVLITGPSGTGKELVARHIHALSPRAKRPFIPVDCASMTDELMASQLFGHVAGAFTGANCNVLGCLRAADGGTLFLDEIGELSYSLQSKLLRVLQERVVTPVGSHQGIAVDVRVVAATNRNLQSEVSNGRFREDLYFRLCVVNLRTIALRERPADLPILVEAFFHELEHEGFPRRKLAQDAISLLLDYHWPGNVRQLRNVLEQAVIESDSPLISCELIGRVISASFVCQQPQGTDGSTPCVATRYHELESNERLIPETKTAYGYEGSIGQRVDWPTLAHVEKHYVEQVLQHAGYNRSAAARILGITRQSLLRKIKQYGIVPPEI
jgi:DNA-binding NtrC family response regulator